MSAKIVGKSWSSIQFSAISDTPITEQDAMIAQTQLGYHPAGYGFFAFDGETIGGQYIVSWSCHACCD